MKKTNAIRILESNGVDFQVKEYQPNETQLDAVSVARKINAVEESVFKTLVARCDAKYIAVFCIPGNMELNFKKAAKAAGYKKVELIKVKELLPLTGYIRGGCSPVGMKKLYPTYIEESAEFFDKIYVSAGVRGMQILLSPAELKRLLNAEFADLL